MLPLDREISSGVRGQHLLHIWCCTICWEVAHGRHSLTCWTFADCSYCRLDVISVQSIFQPYVVNLSRSTASMHRTLDMLQHIPSCVLLHTGQSNSIPRKSKKFKVITHSRAPCRADLNASEKNPSCCACTLTALLLLGAKAICMCPPRTAGVLVRTCIPTCVF